jgi:hypothetical protein
MKGSVRYPGKSTTLASFGCWRCSCTEASTLAAGPPIRSLRSCSRPSLFRRGGSAQSAALRSAQAQGGHDLLERDGSRYAYRLTTKGLEWPYCFCSFTNGCADHSPIVASIINRTAYIDPDCRLEAVYHRADAAIQKVVDLLAASCQTSFVQESKRPAPRAPTAPLAPGNLPAL